MLACLPRCGDAEVKTARSIIERMRHDVEQWDGGWYDWNDVKPDDMRLLVAEFDRLVAIEKAFDERVAKANAGRDLGYMKIEGKEGP